MSETARLAAFAQALRLETLPEAMRERARLALLDGLAIMLGAVDFARENGDRELARYLDLAAPAGSATVVGHGRRTSAAVAAFANGTLCEVLDCSDCNLTARIHNGPGVIPAALAIAETRPVGGAELLTAIIAGYEIGTRLGHAVQPAHWYRGFQITGTFNAVGAAATAARLMRLDADGIAQALGIAGFVMSVSHGDNIFKGHSVKPVHGGQGAEAGVKAAQLAAAGYRSGPLEGEPPRHHAPLPMLGDGRPDLARMVDGLGERWASDELAFKPYPIGLLIIAPVEICLSERAAGLDPARIERIEVTTYADAVHFVGGKYTTTASNFVDAHLSLPFCVAAALTDGAMTPRQLTHARLRDPALHELAARVRVSEDPEMTARYPHEWPVAIAFHLKDGSLRHRRLDQAKWSPRRPPSFAEIAARFHDFAAPVIGRARASQAVELVEKIERQDRIAPLMELVRG